MRPLTLTPDLLRKVDALRELDDAALEAFASEAVGTYRDKGEEVVSHMDASRDVYFIIDGLMRVDLCHTNGVHITFQVLPAGEMFGEVSAIDGLGRTASVSVEEDARLACLSQRKFHSFVHDHPAFGRQVMLRLTGLSRHLAHRYVLHAAIKVRGRVYAILLEMHATQTSPDDPDLIVPPPTDADIASRAGTGRSYVNRVMRHLDEGGVIKKRGDGLKINDVNTLELLLREAETE
ncbi:MAG: Crp/Fnr family transcriptional regulator [Pseudomonadota bacterium]